MENQIKILAISGAALVMFAVVAVGFYFVGNKDNVFLPRSQAQDNTIVTLKTNKGDIVIEVFTSQTPITADNFIKLARKGFYDGTKFHRVIAGFVIQGGDPNSKEDESALYGMGGPGYTIEDEFVEGLSNTRGTISMANSGRPNSGGSQFFINLRANIGLDFDKEPIASKHPVFGKVLKGMNVVNEIARVETDLLNVPTEPVVIDKIIVSDK